MDDIFESTCAAVNDFRCAIDHCHDRLGVSFSQFPKGCCGDVSELLAAFLKDRGVGKFSYVSGWSCDGDDGISHAWLELGKITVDATIDQFSDGKVEEMVTTDSRWYDRFSYCKSVRQDGDFRVLGNSYHLCVAYRKLNDFLSRI